jgi:hypothetical protein
MVLNEAFDIIGSLSFLATVGIAYKIYTMQRKDSEKINRRNTRFRLTEAYFRWNVEMLRSKDNLATLQSIFYPKYDIHQVELIEFMYMILNTLHLEWYLYKDGTHSGEEFDGTLKSLMEPLAKSIEGNRENIFLIRDFKEIFADFPEEFKEAVMNYLMRVYSKHM